MKISNYFIHKGEEMCLSRGNGSGIIYFAGCNMRCCYCNIYEYSQENKGYKVNIAQLAEIFLSFQKAGCNNLNLVNVLNQADEVIEAVRLARSEGLNLPIVCNVSGYEPMHLLRKLDGAVDIYLVDFKYSSNHIGLKYSGVSDYVDVFIAGIFEMFRQTGKTRLNRKGILEKGIVIRHLILPNNLENSLGVLDKIHKLPFKKDVYVSLLNQYVPEYRAYEYSEINCRVTDEEFRLVREAAKAKGLEIIF